MNQKRIERIWRQEGLNVPQKRPKRSRLWLNDGSCVRLRPCWPNHVWSNDFVMDRTHEGQAFRILVDIDEYTRECLALVASGRCCCICHKFCGVRIETHHIRPVSKGGDDSFENCIPLFFDCHAEVENYNDHHPRGSKFSESELRKHRDTCFSKVEEMNKLTPLPSDSPQLIQAVSGNGNMVAGRDLKIHTERVVPKTVVQTDPGGRHISNTTARKIQDLVKDYIDIHTTAGKDTQRAAQRIWSSLKNEFNVTSYKEIPAQDSDRAIQWLQAQVAMATPKIRRMAPDKWKESLYKPIYARAGELGISKDDLYLLAQERLALQKPIRSLKELTQRDLQRLHHVVIYEVKKSGNKP